MKTTSALRKSSFIRRNETIGFLFQAKDYGGEAFPECAGDSGVNNQTSGKPTYALISEFITLSMQQQ